MKNKIKDIKKYVNLIEARIKALEKEAEETQTLAVKSSLMDQIACLNSHKQGVEYALEVLEES